MAQRQERPGAARRPPRGARPSFRPPVLTSALVRRDRLLHLLDLAAMQRLTTVVAPPGYGKTTLLAQWAARQAGDRVRWLAIGPEHDTARRLAEDLCGALEWRTPSLAARLLPRVGMSDVELGEGFLTGLLGELRAMPPLTLVLDDLHLLTNRRLVDELATLVEQAPRSLHVVAGTQIDPPPQYYRLRLTDALVELRQGDLAFTPDEAAALLRGLTRRRLDPGQVEALVRRTEGWAAGLQLVALSLRGSRDVDRFIATFADDDRHVADYLAEHVLDRQPADVRRFLTTTSVLHRLTGPLCDELTGDHQGQAMLDELDRTSMFIGRLDQRRTWFRYHELFRLLLRHHLHDEDPALERELLARAGRWHLARDEVDLAVGYLVEADAWDDVLDAIAACSAALLAEGRVASVARWIAALPPEVVEGRVDVRLLEAGALLFGGDPARVRAALAALDAADASPGQRAVGDVLAALWALQEGEHRRAAARGTRALRAVASVVDAEVPDVFGLTGSVVDVTAAAHLAVGVAGLYEGRWAEARPHLEEVPEGAHAVWQVSTRGALALLEAWSGRLGAAEQAGRHALAQARELGIDQQPGTTARLALAHVALRRGQLARAAALLEEAGNGVEPDRRRVIATIHATEQAALALMGGSGTAGLVLLAARHGDEHPPMPDYVLAHLRAVEAELLVAGGELDRAAQVLALADGLVTSELAAARVHLAVEQGDIRRARAVLDRWAPDGIPQASREHGLWRAVVDHLSGDEAAASAMLEAVAASAGAEGDLGLFRWAGDAVAPPARAAYRATPTPFLRTVVEGFAAPAGGGRPRSTRDLVMQLTDREHAVLALLPTRLSNAEIAERLDVSLNTVKTHIKHVYRKLGVTRRGEAVTEAERLRLL